MSNKIREQKIIIAVLLILNIFMSFMGFDTQLKNEELQKENESLKGKIEMQQSVIADLEENLKNK